MNATMWICREVQWNADAASLWLHDSYEFVLPSATESDNSIWAKLLNPYAKWEAFIGRKREVELGETNLPDTVIT